MIEADYLAVAFKQGFNEAKLQAEERIAALKAVLKPFADDAECYDHLTGDALVPVSVRDIRAARAALGEKE